MKKLHIRQSILLCLVVTLIFNPISASAALLKRGTKSLEVQKVQIVLKELGYFNYPTVTGYYGSLTAKAVKQFQKEYGLLADGIVGSRTKSMLLQYEQKKAQKTDILASTLSVTNTEATNGAVNANNNGALDWYSKVQYIWEKGMNATVTDIDTGKSFTVKRTFGYNHADVEPLTIADSKVIKEIWNGWSWERRAVVVKVAGKTIAGSMTAMPHAGLDAYASGIFLSHRSCNYGPGYNLDAVKGNDANGVLDIHFLNSRTHSTNRVLDSQQIMVKKAGQYIVAMQ